MTMKISTGLRNKMLGLQAILITCMSGNDTTLTLVDGGGSADTLTDSGNGFITEGIFPGDKVALFNCTTGANNGVDYEVVGVAAGTLTFATGQWNTGEALPASGILAVARGGSLRDIFRCGVLRIYSGSAPADADAAVTGTLLLEISESSGAFVAGAFDNGLRFGAAASGAIGKDSTQTWSDTGIISGYTAGYFRLCANPTDAGAISTTLPRIQGNCGGAGSDLVMGSTTVVLGATATVDGFTFTLPSSV